MLEGEFCCIILNFDLKGSDRGTPGYALMLLMIYCTVFISGGINFIISVGLLITYVFHGFCLFRFVVHQE